MGQSEENLPEKVRLLYQAVSEMLAEGADFYKVKVVEISDRAGIGKGTVYEYFENKEDLLVSAMYYCIRTHITEIEQEVRGAGSFRGQVYRAMELIEAKLKERAGFLTFIHYFIGNSEIGRRLRARFFEEEARRTHASQPRHLLYGMLEQARARGEINPNLPEDFCAMELMAKFLTFLVFMGKEDTTGESTEQIRQLLCDGLIAELGGGTCGASA